MPDLTNDQLTLGLLVAACVALIALLLTMTFGLRLRRVRREYMVLRGEGEERDILSTVGRAVRRMEALDNRVDEALTAQEQIANVGRFALQRFGLVRYDAFEDMGGRLSFSAALLDDHGDGLVLTSINGRTETRTYAKPVKSLSSEHNLSDEEQAAIASAMGSRGSSESTPSLSH